MPITNPQEMFVHELCLIIYDAEHQFLEGQQEMAQEATNRELEREEMWFARAAA